MICIKFVFLQLTKKNNMLFKKENYIIMLVGIVFIAVGFILMSGGGLELNKDFIQPVFNGAEKFSFRRITLSPIVIFIGFMIEIYAILKKPSQTINKRRRIE